MYFETSQWFAEVDGMARSIQLFTCTSACRTEHCISQSLIALWFCIENFLISVLLAHVFTRLFELLQLVIQYEIFLETSQTGGHQRKILSKWKEKNDSLNCKIKALSQTVIPFQVFSEIHIYIYISMSMQ